MSWEEEDDGPCDPDEAVSEPQLAAIMGNAMWVAGAKVRNWKADIKPVYSIHGQLLYDPVQAINAFIDAQMYVSGSELARIVGTTKPDMAMRVTTRYRSTISKRPGYKSIRLDDSLTQFFVRREYGEEAERKIWAEIKRRRLEIFSLFARRNRLPTTFLDEWTRERESI